MDIGLRLLFASDIHGQMDIIMRLNERIKVFKPNIVILAGDITDFGNLDEMESLFNEIGKGSNIIKLFVPGNCDPEDSLYIKEIGGAINLHGIKWRYKDYNFLGVGGSLVTPFVTPIEFDDLDIERILTPVEGPSILVSHIPPHGTRVDKIYSGEHIGSVAVKKYINQYSPLLVITGHVHEARGKDIIGNTIIMNPGPGFRGYYGKAIIRNKVTAELDKL
jgi:hypothetical protein